MHPDWWFQERPHAGEEHLDERAQEFDEKLPFDPEPDVALLRELGLAHSDIVIDFGTGTGTFPVAIAPHCNRVIGIDISERMLRIAEGKARSASCSNIELVNSGILEYTHCGDLASYAYSNDMLHHIPDFWKVEELKIVGSTLVTGGIFRFRDFVYSFDPSDSIGEITDWFDIHRSGEFTAEELYTHVRDEFGTYGFLLESMIEAAGFDISESSYPNDFYAEYVCVWRGS